MLQMVGQEQQLQLTLHQQLMLEAAVALEKLQKDVVEPEAAVLVIQMVQMVQVQE
jgi:hypothetical protein